MHQLSKILHYLAVSSSMSPEKQRCFIDMMEIAIDIMDIFLRRKNRRDPSFFFIFIKLQNGLEEKEKALIPRHPSKTASTFYPFGPCEWQ